MKHTLRRLTAFLSAAAICGTALYFPSAVFMASAAVEGIAIDEVNFPDAVFREYVDAEFDTTDDGLLTAEEIAQVTEISLDGLEITNLTGIAHFTNLIWLNCSCNQLTSLDVSKNTALTELSCDNNQLTSLDVSKNTALTELWCEHNQLTSLDMSKNKALEVLHCNDNELTSLDMSKNTKLYYLSFDNNQLTSLDVSMNTALYTLCCENNQLTSLDVSNNTRLAELYCKGNQLTSLDVSKNTSLNTLHCGDNQLTSLDVSKNTSLYYLSFDNNQLTSLDVSKNKGLQKLWCDYNQLTSLDVSNNTFLFTLRCGNNQLTSLDVSKNKTLDSLSCENNQLTSLDVSNNTALTQLQCAFNQLTSLDLSKNADLHSYNTYNNSYEIKLQNGTFDLSTLPAGFDVTKTSNWANATVDGTNLTVTNPNKPVSYTYDCGNESEVLFTLIPAAQKTGDTNSDNAVNASDAAQLLIAAAAIGSGRESGLTAAQEQNADVDKNGKFDASDAALILQYAAAVGSGFEGTMEDFLATLTASSAWKAAYLELAETFEDDVQFDLVYVDEDDVPELVASQPCICYLYTFHEDKVSTLMDGWVFGAMGNIGYSYLPRANRVHNHNYDFAGLLRYDTYMKISPEKTLVEDVVVESWLFKDSNGNGYPDTGEYDDSDYVRYVVNDVEITQEEAETYRNGDYTILSGSMTLAELREALA